MATGGSSGTGGSVTDASAPTDAASGGDAAGPAEAGPFTLTSSAYTEGGMIPAMYTCAGANTSPPLAWSGVPAAAKSLALVFTDLDNNPGAGGFIHWILWDIPPTTTSLMAALPAGMPAGTKGSSFNNNPGYAGPCPGGATHHYIFQLYPLDVATLPNAMNNGDRPTLVTNIKGHQVAQPASLTGTSNAKRM
jgi:Raf kinase inhibitor-like YbhB/YbcL family protein